MSDDFSEVLGLARDIGVAGDGVRPFARKALQVTAMGVKTAARKSAARTGLHGYAASITYDTWETKTGVEGEVGPELGRNQGPLGIVEDAAGGVRSKPQHALRDALKSNEEDFERGLDAAVSDALRGAGL